MCHPSGVFICQAAPWQIESSEAPKLRDMRRPSSRLRLEEAQLLKALHKLLSPPRPMLMSRDRIPQIGGSKIGSPKMEPWEVETWTKTCGTVPWWINFDPYPNGNKHNVFLLASLRQIPKRPPPLNFASNKMGRALGSIPISLSGARTSQSRCHRRPGLWP